MKGLNKNSVEVPLKNNEKKKRPKGNNKYYWFYSEYLKHTAIKKLCFKFALIPDLALQQQKLKAWRPVFLPSTVVPCFYFIGVCFLTFGAVLQASNRKVKEVEVDYTECGALEAASQTCANILIADIKASCRCQVSFTLPERWKEKDIYLYYNLNNYYQNHRRFTTSRDNYQLYGSTSADKTCDPLATVGNTSIAPCGLIANSFFNDSFILKDPSGKVVTLSGKDISWSTDKTRFKNPPPQYNLKEAFKNTTRPPYWTFEVYEMPSSGDGYGNGYENEDFIVWMRTAAVSNFKKLYRRVQGPLEAGSYVLEVNYRYPVLVFDGKKKVVLATTSFFGGKNQFLGLGYIIMGSVTVFSAICFSLVQLLNPRKIGHCRIYY
ncbi:cell cycle control protein 50A-like [Zophobas morio]|uniref:cell cycle control protein 50A-like n=1 Tax=Zophobas morio TaxID=2755281 RepID=UPI003082EDC5